MASSPLIYQLRPAHQAAPLQAGVRYGNALSLHFVARTTFKAGTARTN